jgi:hypothetical protein
MDDPYRDGSFRWWHLDRPSPELLEAHDDGCSRLPGDAVKEDPELVAVGGQDIVVAS